MNELVSTTTVLLGVAIMRAGTANNERIVHAMSMDQVYVLILEL